MTGGGGRESQEQVPWRTVIARRSAELMRQRRRVRRRGSVESVHDLRVASRRFQEAIDFWEPYLPSRERTRATRRAARIRRALGATRDADVALVLLRRIAGRLPARERRAARRLAETIAAPAARGRSAGGGGIQVPGIRRRIAALLAALPDGKRAPIGARAVKVIAGRLANLARPLRHARQGDVAAMHRLRIAVKRYRYALEILEEAGWHGVRPAIAEARSLQRRLGRLRDLEILIGVIGRSRDAGGAARLRTRLAAARRRHLAGAATTLRRFDPGARWRAFLAAHGAGARAPSRRGEATT